MELFNKFYVVTFAFAFWNSMVILYLLLNIIFEGVTLERRQRAQADLLRERAHRHLATRAAQDNWTPGASSHKRDCDEEQGGHAASREAQLLVHAEADTLLAFSQQIAEEKGLRPTMFGLELSLPLLIRS